MRIVHAVTLVSDNGAFGGPVSVATTQLRALRARGHDVALTALWGGAGSAPTSIDDIEFHAGIARTFVPGTGSLGKFSVHYARILWRTVGSADVVHVHTGRDLASLAALGIAAVRGKPVVVQTHGMVDVRNTRRARAFDRLLRPLIRRASACLVLTAAEAAGLESVLGKSAPPLIRLANGVQRGRPDVRPRERTQPTVLYLARLHSRKRPTAFVQAAELILRELPDVQFDVYGPDEGALPEMQAEIARLGLGAFVTYHGAVDHEKAQRITAAADVYVLPSVREPFPMSVLEALAVGTPVVCTTSTGISDELARRGAAVVTDGSPSQLAKATVAILRDQVLRDGLVSAGDRAVSEVFSIDAVAGSLEQTYLKALGRPAATGVGALR
jgi:glycosyltransferase involved in cell wall biosynthesis